jgi:hypothetical protein
VIPIFFFRSRFLTGAQIKGTGALIAKTRRPESLIEDKTNGAY